MEKEKYIFTCRDDYKDYAESMLHDSGEEIARLEDVDGKYRLTLDVYGNKDVVYNCEHYRYTQDFPDKLIELFKEGEVDSDFDTTIVENNWLDITFYRKKPTILGGDYYEYVDDMVFEEDLAMMTEEQLKDYMIANLLAYIEAYPDDNGDDDDNNEEGGDEMNNEYNKHVQKYVVLQELCEDTVDGIILYETSTAEEIQRCIDEMKENIPDYQWGDLIDCLPKDCVVYETFGIKKVYY